MSSKVDVQDVTASGGGIVHKHEINARPSAGPGDSRWLVGGESKAILSLHPQIFPPQMFVVAA